GVARAVLVDVGLVGGLERIQHREVGRIGVAADIGVTRLVDRQRGDLVTFVVGGGVAAAAQVGGVQQLAASGIQLGDEAGVGILVFLVDALEGIGRREIGRRGLAGHIDVAAAVDSDGRGLVVAAATEIGGIDQRAAGGIHLGDEGSGLGVDV